MLATWIVLVNSPFTFCKSSRVAYDSSGTVARIHDLEIITLPQPSDPMMYLLAAYDAIHVVTQPQ